VRAPGIVIVPRHGTNLPALIPPDSRELARVYERVRRCHHVRRQRYRVRWSRRAAAVERLGNAPKSAWNARVRSSALVFHAAPQRDGHGRSRPAIRPPVDGSRNVIRRCTWWTCLKGLHLPEFGWAFSLCSAAERRCHHLLTMRAPRVRVVRRPASVFRARYSPCESVALRARWTARSGPNDFAVRHMTGHVFSRKCFQEPP
jgi:hypothetical protein